MNDNEMRIAIAECVFEHIKTEKRLVAHQNKTHELLYGGHDSFGLWIWMEPDGRRYGMNYDTLEELERGSINEIAERNNYFRDLNAMHEAEKALKPELRDQYLVHLSSHIDEQTCDLDPERAEWLLATVTAAQRAEAFLRTIGKWKSK